MTIQVERNVPLPERAGNKYPFSDMEVGDSFALPKSDRGAKSLSAAARSHAVRIGQPDRRFAQRVNGETIRIWRVA